MDVSQRTRKRSKRLSESNGLLYEEEPPAKKTRRTKSTSNPDKPSRQSLKNTKQVSNKPSKKTRAQTQAKGSKKLIVSLDFANNDRLSLGGVPISQLSPQPTSSRALVRGKGQRSSKALGSECSSPGNNSEQSIVTGKQSKMHFKKPKFCVRSTTVTVLYLCG